ncbi:immunoglobulin superfamily member 11-like isoform X4 [Megalobrama amblycephala]|uniref:immunoglobulin superfamily member 11-like isoform X4 n=1 Tax=Megalobrama amblycephala TaxID=75352 RepID=UPI0020142E27|nr:immunoglobulin superfamily member 11-like isoform X4 [Megalobrama amblycephala]
MSFKTIYLMLMLVRMAPALPLIFLLMIHRVSSAGWGVSYSPSHICALKDSSVIMKCTYTYPTGYQIMRVFWFKGPVTNGKEPPDLSIDPDYRQRLQYLGDKQQNCTIRLSHVTLKDSRMYYFRFITNKPDGRYTGDPGVTLTITGDFDLQVESPERVTEGDSVRLTCKSSCTLTDRATFIWYRNSQPLTERRDRNNELLLQSVRREDAGRYSCAVHGHNHISPAVQLNVMFHHGAGRNVIVIAATSGGLFIIIIIIIIILFIIKKRRRDKTEDLTVKQNDLYSDASQRASVHDEPLSEPDSANDAPYASVKPKRFRGNTPESRETEEIQYATVQHPRKKKTKREEENENQYDNIRVHQFDAAVRQSVVETV